jgi:hypothetical protein
VHTFDVRGIVLGSDNHEIVPSNLATVHAVTLADELLLGLRVVHQHEVGIAAPRGLKCLASPLGDTANLDAGGLCEQRQNATEQPGVLNGRG